MRKHIKKTVHITFGGVAVVVGLLVISGIVEYLLIKANTIRPGVNAPDVANLTYDINGASFNLKDGMSSNPYVSGSNKPNSLSLYGDPVYADFDQDKDIDAATILVDNTTDNNSFYYGVLVVNDNGTFLPTNVIYLGSKINAPTAKVIDGHVVYSYTINAQDTSSPASSKSLWINYDKGINKISESVESIQR